MTQDDFYIRIAARWSDAILTVNPAELETIQWDTSDVIVSVLTPFMGDDYNHALLPGGGGMDILSVTKSNEPGCIELRTSSKSAFVVKPEKLTMEHYLDHPAETFLLLELGPLAPSNAYDPEEFTGGAEREEVVEIARGQYEPREVWDRGCLGVDEHGAEIPFPDETRLITRLQRGKVMFVMKGAIWNGKPETYDGRHGGAASGDLRSAIEQMIEAA